MDTVILMAAGVHAAKHVAVDSVTENENVTSQNMEENHALELTRKRRSAVLTHAQVSSLIGCTLKKILQMYRIRTFYKSSWEEFYDIGVGFFSYIHCCAGCTVNRVTFRWKYSVFSHPELPGLVQIWPKMCARTKTFQKSVHDNNITISWKNLLNFEWDCISVFGFPKTTAR